MEYKSISLEMKDLDKGSRTAIIAHAEFDTMDRVRDISRKGMFNKSWTEHKSDISFYLNHNDEQSPGKVVDVFEDDKHAYTKTWLGTHTLGNDTLIMMDEGVIKKASFGYFIVKDNRLPNKIRELKEVRHIETSVLTKMPAHPGAGVVQVNKSFDTKSLDDREQEFLKRLAANTQATVEDLVKFSGTLDSSPEMKSWVNWVIERHSSMIGDYRSQLKYNAKELKEMKDHVMIMEKFVRDTKASDECIKSIADEILSVKTFLSEYDTAATHLIDEPTASKNDEMLILAIKQFTNSIKN